MRPSVNPSEPLLEIRGIAKDFGPVRVLQGIDLALQPGEVHALLGENGAGKSTLMKTLAGYHQPSEGIILVSGKPVVFRDSGDAEAHGIVLIHQEMNLAEDLTVEENIFLGREVTRGAFVDSRTMVRLSREILEELETRVDPRTRVRDLTVSQKQMVEIAKAISRDARVLIMDEPTDVLTGSETAILFRLIRRLKEQDVTVVFISHKLDEVKEISDRVTVLRDGELVATRATAELTQDQMASLMVGRQLSDMYPPKQPIPDSPVVFAAKNVTVPGWARDVSFELHRGEILGFAGLVGAGRTELIEGILGLRPRSSGSLYRNGQPLSIRSLQDAKAASIAYLSEDRKGKGLIVDMLLRPNLTLLSLEQYADPFVNQKKERAALERAVETYGIRVPRLETRASTLSGGNQQKVVLAKIMEINPEIIILDEPTRGIDIGTKRQIYFLMQELTRAGKSVILISSEMQELIGLCHRVIVMRSGTVTGILTEAELVEDEIVRYATGLKGAKVHAAV
jgi:ribose transport system ATP-binding protein